MKTVVVKIYTCGYAFVFFVVLSTAACAEDKSSSSTATANSVSEKGEPSTATLRGKVVWLADALRRRFGIETDRDAEHDVAALETAEGELFHLVRDARGRGFWLDQRLRDHEFEIYVRRFPKSPMIQVIRVFTLRPEGKYELDYWCDICAIPMYELKACECCQGPTRLRERRVAQGNETGTDGDEPADPSFGGKSAPAQPTNSD